METLTLNNNSSSQIKFWSSNICKSANRILIF